MEDVVISLAPVERVIDLRHAVLRKGLPRESAIFPGDEASSSRHFMAEVDGAVVGCVTLHLNEWANEPAWQLRGMAVAESHQGTGVGSKLLLTVERSITESPAEVPRLLWCNARMPAAVFYGRHGWQVVSEVFEIPSAGPHVKMIKRIVMNDE